MSHSVLIVDDEKGIRMAFAQALQSDGHEVFESEDGTSALKIINEEKPEVILLDMKLPDMSGLDILRKIRKEGRDAIVIMMTAFGDIELAVEAMQLGAENFRMKPFNIHEMKSCINKALDNKKYKSQLESFKNAEKQKYSVHNIIGESKVVRQINDLIKKIATSPTTTVLIQGASGTGKELVARAIHYNSSRCDNQFIEVNCTAIPESLLESELFGHEKGSFTDAKKEHKGIFEQADGGTLFLDEIGDMPLQMQTKLLRVLQEKKFKRVGGNRNISVDVRVIASTNINLEEAVKRGAFREDLFYRLNVIPINLPQLKDRENDSLLIAKYYLRQFSSEFKKQFKGFTASAEESVLSYKWPGNVRELKNLIERAVLLENSEYLDVRHLHLNGLESYFENNEPSELPQSEPEKQKEQSALPAEPVIESITSDVAEKEDSIQLNVASLKIDDVEKALIEKALKENNWNRNLVSKIVGINRTTLYSKIKKYDLEKNISD